MNLIRTSWISLLVFSAVPARLMAQPSQAATAGFDSYVQTVEARLARQHASARSFLSAEDETRLRRGEWMVELVTPADGGGLPGARLHHWRGSAFVPGATAAEFEEEMRDFADYPRRYTPSVVTTTVVEHRGDAYQIRMRVRQRHGITVTLDTAYDVGFGELDARHGFSASRSTAIQETGTSEDHGFLWRQNTYWSWEERGGGVWIQMESVSLTRSVPIGLGWLIGPYVESIPRESLAFTLGATCRDLQAAIRQQAEKTNTSERSAE